MFAHETARIRTGLRPHRAVHFPTKCTFSVVKVRSIDTTTVPIPVAGSVSYDDPMQFIIIGWTVFVLLPNGTVDLDISPLAAEMILQTLRPVVHEHTSRKLGRDSTSSEPSDKSRLGNPSTAAMLKY